MKIGLIILLIINLILVVILIGRKRQVKNICRQLSFFRENDSNMLISCGNRTGGMGELADELNMLASDVRKHHKDYLEKEKNIAQIYTNLSHDIRTPLTSLDGYFQLLQESDDEVDRARYISIIRERIDSLSNMLEELFTYTKLKNEAYELELSNVDITKLLKQVIISYYDEWNTRGIRPIIDIEEDTIEVYANAQGLRRSIENIVKNVLVHGEKEIKISLKKEKEGSILTISNYVLNPDEINVDRVFERFYKADEARSTTSSGLGLSIAYGFVKKMGGSIDARLNNNEFEIIITF